VGREVTIHLGQHGYLPISQAHTLVDPPRMGKNTA
jgi:hypothetical protein